MLNRTMSLF